MASQGRILIYDFTQRHGQDDPQQGKVIKLLDGCLSVSSSSHIEDKDTVSVALADWSR